ncbi:type II toxin-antitoxin system VapC family toxin [Rosistilla oblonga]|uniref:type II toxin-antitoxin system VapC family toxin n=1 Tax=Rosistilla oblonga TaxID=2527990 RepID=UPI003A969912
MRVLLDSHAVIWWVDQHRLLSPNALAAVTDPSNELFVSAATVWEIGIKVGLGKLRLSLPYRTWMNQALTDLRATTLPITVDYSDIQSRLPKHHGDPFDRLMVAQSLADHLSLVSSDTMFDGYGVTRIW